jgi:hypothetical protein
MGNVNHVVAETYIQRSKSEDIPTQRGVPMFLGPAYHIKTVSDECAVSPQLGVGL